MGNRRFRLLLSYLIVFCLTLIQFAPLVTVVQAEGTEENESTSVLEEIAEGNEPATESPATTVVPEESTKESEPAVVPEEITEENEPTTVPQETAETNEPVVVPEENEQAPTPSELAPQVEETPENFNDYPSLLITEISPNSAGEGTDLYEFFEVYNNTNKMISLNNYSFMYLYTDGSKPDVALTIPENTVIEPQQTLVFWYNPGEKTIADFKANFGTNIPDEQILIFTGFSGFANGGNRGIAIRDKAGMDIVSASYLSGESDNTGKGIQYQYPKTTLEMDKLAGMADPTPGTFQSAQVPATPVNIEELPEDMVAPVIEHSPVTTSEAYQDILIQATITDDVAVPYGTLYYKKEGSENFTTLTMNLNAENPGQYSVAIPSADVESNLIYYIEAGDGKNNSRTDEMKIAVSKPDIDYNSLPSLLVTEVVPDSTNVDGADGYEFIEIYNNSNQDINFKDYKIQYRYGTDPETDVIWESVPNDFVIPAKGTVAFWIINDKNGAQTVADFNENYGTKLVENQDIVKIHSAGMANGSTRGIVIATNTDHEISVAYYQDESGVDDTFADKGITYKFPVNGSNVMTKVSRGEETATPGTVSSSQVPSQPVMVPEDKEAPSVEDLTGKTEIKQTEDLILSAHVKDNVIAKTVALYYKNNNETEFKKVLLQQDYNDLLYYFTIYSPDLIAKKSIEYYYVVSDGSNETKSETYKINIINEKNQAPFRLNVGNGDILSGEQVLKASSDEVSPEKVKLFIDEKEVAGNTFRSLESESYLAFEVSGVNTFFQNGVTMGDEVIQIFDDGIPQWKTITIPISPEKLKQGDNIFTIRSGDKATPFPTDNGENRDDYSLRNVRLVLPDGTIIRDPLYNEASKVIAMNDANAAVNFTLAIPVEKMLSKTYKWDTAKVGDGEYTIVAKDGKNTDVKAKVKVDNTAPVITTNMEKDKEYKGPFTIDTAVTDALSGIEATEVKLDDEVITVPYVTSSSQLSPGAHTLSISAVDKVGNQAEIKVPFSVIDENPTKPELISPQEDADNVNRNALLKVKVTDPTNDDMKVSFYKGFQYRADDDEVKVYKNAVDTEPPQTMTPEGEAELGDEEISKISSSDDDYLVTDSDTQFPYHRFDVNIDSTVDESDIVELSWEGHSLEGRKVSMYAWSHHKNDWILLDFKIAGSEDFTLKENVAVGEFVKDSKINVLVQDEIPVSSDDYDYTFAWISDTQYYSESYPHIYDRMTQWIVENQEALKIKYVFHTGDLVDESDKEYQWDNASRSMKTLDDANVPYGVLAGNHDVDHKTWDYTQYYRFFGEDRFKDRPHYGGSYKNNRGHYDLISVNGNDYIMVYMGWGVDEESISWINEVLAQHPHRKAILSFHEYLLASGTRHPLGDKIYNEIVVPNKNVIATLSGHYHEAQTLIDEIDDNRDGKPDRKVYQILMDYQAGPEGGQGYLRLLHFDQEADRIIVNTYSPYKDDYNFYDTDQYGEKDEFIIELNLDAQKKRIATDAFAVNIYTDSLIDSKKNVKSSHEAQGNWKGLAANGTYSWYAVAEDDYTGKTRSDIWTFTTGTKNGSGSGGGGGSSSGGGNEPSKPEPSTPAKPNETVMPSNALEVVTETNGEKVTKVKPSVVNEIVDSVSSENTILSLSLQGTEKVSIPSSLFVEGNKKNSHIKIKIMTADASYSLPIDEINVEELAKKLQTTSEEVTIEIAYETVANEKLESFIQDHNLKPVSNAFSFKVEATANGNKEEISVFNTFVESEITGEQSFDGSKSVAISLNEDGTISALPTIFNEESAVIKSLNNASYVIVENNVAFSDVNNGQNWAESYIETLASKYIIKGKPGGIYAPAENMTRAEFSVLLVRALGLPKEAYDGRFKDVSGTEWFSKDGDLTAAVKYGIIQGKEDNLFAPHDNITRSEAAVMISRAMELDFVDVNEEVFDTSKKVTEFKDADSIPAWAKEEVERIYQAQIMEGMGDGSFNPNAFTKRDQIAKILAEFLISALLM